MEARHEHLCANPHSPLYSHYSIMSQRKNLKTSMLKSIATAIAILSRNIHLLSPNRSVYIAWKNQAFLKTQSMLFRND